jgi:hypothetical protein
MKKYLQILLTAVIGFGLMAGCTSTQGMFQETKAKENNEQIKVRIGGNLNMAFTLEEMNQEADYIVIGKYTQLKKKVNSARDVNDPSKESEEEYHEGEVYDFAVDQVLKGKISEKSILVEVPKKMQLTDPEDLRKYEIIDPNYIQPKMDQKYILFLDKADGDDYYGIPFFPYVLEIQDNQILKVVKPDPALRIQELQAQSKQIHVEGDSFVDAFQDLLSGKRLQDVLESLLKKNS